jgi:hypothetical protein
MHQFGYNLENRKLLLRALTDSSESESSLFRSMGEDTGGIDSNGVCICRVCIAIVEPAQSCTSAFRIAFTLFGVLFELGRTSSLSWLKPSSCVIIPLVALEVSWLWITFSSSESVTRRRLASTTTLVSSTLAVIFDLETLSLRCCLCETALRESASETSDSSSPP